MFGSLVPGLLMLFEPATRADRRSRAILVGLAVLVPVAAAAAIVAASGPERGLALARWSRDPWTVVALGALGGALGARLASGRGDRPARAAWAASVLGVALVMAPELVYLHDGFGTRMNTIFKLYYQAWLLFALAGAFAIALAWDHASAPRRWLARAAAAAATVGVAFTAAAAWDVTGGFAASPSLDALAHVPAGERGAIEWVRSHLPPDALVLQAAGRSYAAEESRLSVGTGRATLLGWDGHEVQWRGRAFGSMAAGRAEAAQAVYTARDRATLVAALDAWKVDYVFVGPAERRRYGMDDANEQLLHGALDVAFERDDARIYRRRVIE
jgi:uncharacterized membrane protein